MKQGANFQDQNRIKELAEEGLSVEEVSEKLRIAPAVCAGFMGEDYEEPEIEVVEENEYLLNLGEDTGE